MLGEEGLSYRDLLIALLGAIALVFLKFLIYLVRLVAYRYSQYARIAEYDCSVEGSGFGEIAHGIGDKENDSPDGPVWVVYASNMGVYKNREPYPLRGPFVNDFGVPGEYTVIFSIKGENFKKDYNAPILRLEVTELPEQWEALERSHIQFSPITRGKKLIRGKDLASGKWRNYSINCYSTGRGIYEYRAFLYKENFNQVLRYRLRFKRITVKRKPEQFRVL